MFMQRITIEEAVKIIQATLDRNGVARVTDLPVEEQQRLFDELKSLLKQAAA